MSLLYKVIQESKNNKRIKIDLKNKNLLIDNKYFIKNKEVDDSITNLIVYNDLIDYGIDECDVNCWDVLYNLYELFKYSVPRKNKKYQKKSYFKAIDHNELSDKELIENMDRTEIQNVLEAYVLICSLMGKLVINNQHWFWQSKEDKDLIVLKEWL